MNNILNGIVYFSLLIFTLTSCSGVDNNTQLDAKLSGLLDKKDFFRLRDEVNKKEADLSEFQVLYYKAICENLFNNGQQSNEYIDKLLNKYGDNCSDSIRLNLLNIKAANYVHAFQYKKAAETYELILNRLENVLDSSSVAAYANVFNLWNTLGSVNPQKIHKTGYVTIKSYRNQFNHLMVPVKSGGVNEDFIFDTGANLSTISESYAKKMGLTFYESDIKVGGSTGTDVQTSLAVADSLYIGDLLVENVVFLVSPDEDLSFPAVNLYINGIIGFPVILQMEEVQFDNKEVYIHIPDKVNDKGLYNMCMDNLHPIIEVKSGNDTLLFTLDTGARSTDLSRKYYDGHKEYVEENGELVNSQRGGAGGLVEVNEYHLKDFPFAIGSKTTVLPSVAVSLNEYSFNKYFDGNIGQDVFNQFDKMILNFKYMYIDFE